MKYIRKFIVHSSVRGLYMPAEIKNVKGTLRRLLFCLAESKLLLIGVIFCVILSTVSSLFGSYAISPVINTITSVVQEQRGLSGLVTALVPILLILALVYAVGVAASYLQSRLMIKVSQRTVWRMREQLFAKLQYLPVRYYDSHTHGELMSRFTNDIDMVSEGLNNTVVNLTSSVLSLLGIFIMMLVLRPLPTLISLLIVPFMCILVRVIVKKSGLYFREQQAAIGSLNGYIEEIIEGQRVVKIFCREKRTAEDFSRFNTRYFEKASRAQIASGIMIPLMQNISSINYAFTAAAGGILCIATGLSLGSLAAFLNYSRQFGRPLNEIANMFNIVESALAGAERIFEVMDEPVESPDDPDSLDPLALRGHVCFENVSFGYIPEKPVLRHVTLDAHPGSKVALVGSTGAGKTTITNLLTRLYDIQDGSITIDGMDIRSIRRSVLRKNIAMVLQDTHLFAGSVIDNIRYGRLEASDEECIAAARLANADHFIVGLKDGYNTQLSSDGSELSQGQRQLLNIARAAVANPAVLVLDEATSSIDTRTEQMIEKGMDSLMQGRTTFVIAHRLSTVRNADVMLVIVDGLISERGRHSVRLALGGRYAALYSGQAVLS